MFFIDSHAHLYLKDFDEDRSQMIERAIAAKVIKIVLPNIDIATIELMYQLETEFPGICCPTMGLHPCDAKENWKEVLDQMELEFVKRKFIAIGESGTDAYWDTSYMQQQILSFERQISWAKQYHIPIIIHSRETLEQNIEIIRSHQDGTLKAIFHCFSGTVDQLNQIKELQCYVGIGGSSTYKNVGIANILAEEGLDNVLLETDAPFLTPVPFRGKRNESAFIPIIAEHLSAISGIPIEQIAKITSQNAMQLFDFEHFERETKTSFNSI